MSSSIPPPSAPSHSAAIAPITDRSEASEIRQRIYVSMQESVHVEPFTDEEISGADQEQENETKKQENQERINHGHDGLEGQLAKLNSGSGQPKLDQDSQETLLSLSTGNTDAEKAENAVVDEMLRMLSYMPGALEKLAQRTGLRLNLPVNIGDEGLWESVYINLNSDLKENEIPLTALSRPVPTAAIQRSNILITQDVIANVNGSKAWSEISLFVNGGRSDLRGKSLMHFAMVFYCRCRLGRSVRHEHLAAIAQCLPFSGNKSAVQSLCILEEGLTLYAKSSEESLDKCFIVLRGLELLFRCLPDVADVTRAIIHELDTTQRKTIDNHFLLRALKRWLKSMVVGSPESMSACIEACVKPEEILRCDQEWSYIGVDGHLVILHHKDNNTRVMYVCAEAITSIESTEDFLRFDIIAKHNERNLKVPVSLGKAFRGNDAWLEDNFSQLMKAWKERQHQKSAALIAQLDWSFWGITADQLAGR